MTRRRAPIFPDPRRLQKGRRVEIVRFAGARQLGPELLSEAYLVRCVAGRPLHSVLEWLPGGGYVVLKDLALTVLADPSQLRPLPGFDLWVDVDERVPAEAQS